MPPGASSVHINHPAATPKFQTISSLTDAYAGAPAKPMPPRAPNCLPWCSPSQKPPREHGNASPGARQPQITPRKHQTGLHGARSASLQPMRPSPRPQPSIQRKTAHLPTCRYKKTIIEKNQLYFLLQKRRKLLHTILRTHSRAH